MGVPMGRPPANALPPRTEWQEMQSPARARYSPRSLPAVGGLLRAFACRACAENEKRSRQEHFIRFMKFALVDVCYAAASDTACRRQPAGPRRPAATAVDAPCSDRSVGQISVHDRQRANALACRGEDRIRDRAVRSAESPARPHRPISCRRSAPDGRRSSALGPNAPCDRCRNCPAPARRSSRRSCRKARRSDPKITLPSACSSMVSGLTM